MPSFYLRFVGSDTLPKSLSRREVEECFGLSAEDIHELRPPRFRGTSKLYAWHAPEVECIAKGKSRTPYEFGVKVGIAATLKHNLIVGARAFTGNPFDGHTLNAQLEQATILMQDTGCKPATAYVDLGYRGVDADNPGVVIKHRGKFKTLTAQERKLLRRRQAIEPIIGHLKADHRMDRCHLKGEQGDRLHAVLCGAGYNLRWLLRMIAKKGVPFLRRLYLRLRRAAALAPNWSRIVRKLDVKHSESRHHDWPLSENEQIRADEGGGLPAAALFTPIPNRGAISELVSDAAQAARPCTQQSCPSLALALI